MLEQCRLEHQFLSLPSLASFIILSTKQRPLTQTRPEAVGMQIVLAMLRAAPSVAASQMRATGDDQGALGFGMRYNRFKEPVLAHAHDDVAQPIVVREVDPEAPILAAPAVVPHAGGLPSCPSSWRQF